MYAVTDGLEFSAAEQKEGALYTQLNGQPCLYEDGVIDAKDLVLMRRMLSGQSA